MEKVIIAGRQIELPSLLLGTEYVSIEANKRLAIPAIWKPSFSTGKAFLADANLGGLAHKMLIPEVNLRILLGEIEERDVREAIYRSANEVSVDSQGRLVVFRDEKEPPAMVTMFGYVSHLKIFDEKVAEDLTASDADRLGELFREL